MHWFYWLLITLFIFGTYHNLKWAYAGGTTEVIKPGTAAASACLRIAVIFGLLIVGGVL